jgi:hypothetical protein
LGIFSVTPKTGLCGVPLSIQTWSFAQATKLLNYSATDYTDCTEDDADFTHHAKEALIYSIENAPTTLAHSVLLYSASPQKVLIQNSG